MTSGPIGLSLIMRSCVMRDYWVFEPHFLQGVSVQFQMTAQNTGVQETCVVGCKWWLDSSFLWSQLRGLDWHKVREELSSVFDAHLQSRLWIGCWTGCWPVSWLPETALVGDNSYLQYICSIHCEVTVIFHTIYSFFFCLSFMDTHITVSLLSIAPY